MSSAWFRSTFLRGLIFVQIKDGGTNFLGEPISQNVWIIWSALVYFNLKNSMDSNSSSFIRFESFLHQSAVLLSESWDFYKLNRRDLISGRNQFCRMSELFRPPFCILILKVLWSQILRQSLQFNVFCMTQEHFSDSLEIFTNERRWT